MNEDKLNNLNRKISQTVRNNEILRGYYKTIFSNNSVDKYFLDLSCGSRTDIRNVVESFGFKWIGVDIIDSNDVIKADSHDLPFYDSKFDVVFSAATFEHYYNPWQVAKEVSRVLKPGGYFCGLIAFLQPWHGNSYYHFSHNGIKQMLKEIDFKILDLHAGDEDGISYIIKKLFPPPLTIIGKIFGLYGKILLKMRSSVLPNIIKILYSEKNIERKKKLKFLGYDELRFAASIIFLAQKQESDNSLG